MRFKVQSFLSGAGDRAREPRVFTDVCQTVPHTRPLLVETIVPHQKAIIDEGGAQQGIAHCSYRSTRSAEQWRQEKVLHHLLISKDKRTDCENLCNVHTSIIHFKDCDYISCTLITYNYSRRLLCL